MSTFQELTEGAGLAAERVKGFFKAICDTFSPTHTESSDQRSTSLLSEPQEHSKKSRKRRGSSPAEDTASSKKPKKLNLIVVAHLLPTLPAYLNALKEIGTIKVIIFKGPAELERPAHMKDMAKWVEEHELFGGAVHKMRKNDLKVKDSVADLLSNAIDSDGGEILIMDIGGYFAPCLSVLSKPDELKRSLKLLGIVEDTENGHQKYHHAIDGLRVSEGSKFQQPNIFSVARSRMKMTEDYNVGKSLVRAADSILRQSLDLRLEDHRTIGVLGFGKIGSSIAMHLRQQHIGIVMVYDVNPEILLRASSYDFVICTKEQMLQQASFIFCATGNKALTYNDLLKIGSDIKRLIIASCTSADDELDVHDGLKRHDCRNSSTDPLNFTRYNLIRLSGEPAEIILLCDGNAVNFSYRAVLGESIRSVQAAMMVCALNLQQMALQNKSCVGISTLTNEEEMRIARLWLQHFSELDVHLITNVSCAHMKYDRATIEDNVGDLPVDKTLVTELKKQLGLLQAPNTDPTDFMDSMRKLIIAAVRGSGKTAVLFDLIHDVRNYYDLIWWFDCNDSLNGTLLSLAQEFHISYLELSLAEMQKAVLEAVFSSLTVNNILLVVDNVQEFTGEIPSEITARMAGSEKDRNVGVSHRCFKCHEFLSILDEIVNRTSRRQRRCHIVALYTDDNTNQLKEAKQPLSVGQDTIQPWRYLIPQDISINEAKNWIIGKLPTNTPSEQKNTWQKYIGKILSTDVRRLTVRLTALLATHQWITGDAINRANEMADKRRQNEKIDILPHLIKLFLQKLEESNKLFFMCVQVVSLIHAGSISRETFYRLYKILPNDMHNQTCTTNWDSTWQNLLTTLKAYCILKQNLLVPMIHKSVSQRYIPPDYVEVYSVPSSYARELRKPLVADRIHPVWKYAVELIIGGFTYDYYSSNKADSSKYDQTIVPYLIHATALIKHIGDCTGKEEYALSLGNLLCRLGSFHLNERRQYSEASTFYRKAHQVYEKLFDRAHANGSAVSQDNNAEISVAKYSSKIMWLICDQLSEDSAEQADTFICQIEEIQNDLKKLRSDLGEKYKFEAIIAIARIRLQKGRNETVEEERTVLLNLVETELDKIKNKPHMSVRTQSLLLQILGSTYSLLNDYQEAIKLLDSALESRERILPPEHLDTARTRYRLANCLIESLDKKSDAALAEEKIHRAQSLCALALKTQKTQLPIKHRNLQECMKLSQKIRELLDN